MRLVTQLGQEATHVLKGSVDGYYKEVGNRWYRLSSSNGFGEWVLANPDAWELTPLGDTKEAQANLPNKVGRPSASYEATCTQTGKVTRYNSMGCARKDGFSRSKILDCCNGKQFTHKGFKWRRFQ